MNRFHAALCLLLAVVLAACTGTPEEPAPSAAASPPARPGGTPEPAGPSEAPTGPAAVLGPAWVIDTDDDAVPDAVEAAVGTDPQSDECAETPECGDIGGVPNPLVTAERGANTLLILDASGSMAGAAGGGGTKLRDAKRAITSYVVGLPDFIDAGLMVYGHVGSNEERDKARSCRGIETFAPLGELTHETVDGVLDQFEPVGWTPIAGALRVARREFAGTGGADNRIILVSDGIETCDGSPIRAARRLAADDVSVTVDVVGFDVDAAAARQLERVAQVTGGTYTEARSAAQLSSYFDAQRRRIAELERQWRCLASNRNRVSTCYSRARRAAIDGFLAEQLRAADDPREEDALATVVSTLDDAVSARIEGVSEVADVRMSTLLDQLRTARRRWERRYRRSAIGPMGRCGDVVAFGSPSWS
jgi:hypothetical protein